MMTAAVGADRDFSGALLVSGGPEYDAARRVWNGMSGRRPAAAHPVTFRSRTATASSPSPGIRATFARRTDPGADAPNAARAGRALDRPGPWNHGGVYVNHRQDAESSDAWVARVVGTSGLSRCRRPAEGGPVVLKPTFGYDGAGVGRVYDLERDGGTVDRLPAAHPVLTYLPYLPHAEGGVRITLVCEEAVLDRRRVPPGGDRRRADVTRGARSVDVDVPEELLDVARCAARARGRTVAAPDFLPGAEGRLPITEIDNTGDWYSVPEKRQEQIAKSLHRLVEERMRELRPWAEVGPLHG